MGTIQSGVGLASGLNISEIIDALINAQKGPITKLTTRVTNYTTEQSGIAALSASVLSLSTSASTLSLASTFNKRAVTVADTNQLSVTSTGSAAVGSYQFQAVRKASTQQLLSKGYATSSAIPGEGTITLSRGGGLSSGTRLDALNGGAGVDRGKIRLTDRSGATTTVDLSGAVTVDDVLQAINSQTSVRISASVKGDGLVLTDLSGSTATNLKVEDIGSSATAADLGIAGTGSGTQLAGSDVFEVTGAFKLTQINDGLAPRFIKNQDDIRITLTDVAETTIDVDLDGAVTLSDVVSKINDDADNAGKVAASISDGRLVLTDLTGGGAHALTVEDINGATAARGLGLTATASSNVLTGNRLSAGINSVLLRNLNGGAGISELGSITVTDRTGTSATLDLSTAETLDDVLQAINSAESSGNVKLQLSATLNAAGNGIQIRDTSGATATNFSIADEVGSSLAEELGIETDSTATTVNSGSLRLQTVNEATTLANYGLAGRVRIGSLTIKDSAGGETVINVSSNDATLGDVIDKLNAVQGIQITAKLNEFGDGIEIVDDAGGPGQLTIGNLGNSNTATDLRIAATGTTGTDGKSHLIGRTATVITVAATDTLQAIATKLNNAKAGVSAATIDDGTSVAPIRLNLKATASGAAGRIIVDDGGLGLGLATLVKGDDAVLRVGDDALTGFVLSSSTNKFDKAVSGLTIELKTVGAAATDVTVLDDSSGASAAISTFVDNYNKLQDAIKDLTKFDFDAKERGALQANTTPINVQQRFQGLVNKRYAGTNSTIQTLADIGITSGAGAKLTFNADKFATALANHPQEVQDLFRKASTGFAAQVTATVNAYTDKTIGTLTQQGKTIQANIDNTNARIGALNDFLDTRRQRLLFQFTKMETAISQLNSQQSSLAKLATLVSSSKDD